MLATISAHVRLLPAGFKTRAAPVVVPSWAKAILRASRQLVLFGYSDKASQAKLKLYRERNL